MGRRLRKEPWGSHTSLNPLLPSSALHAPNKGVTGVLLRDLDVTEFSFWVGPEEGLRKSGCGKEGHLEDL